VKAAAAASVLCALLVVAFGIRHARMSEAAAEARGMAAAAAELRAALDEGARRAAALVRRSRSEGTAALGFPVSVATSEIQGTYSQALADATHLERTDETKALDALLALVLSTSDPSEQVAAMRGAARILARRDARAPARRLLEEALLVEGASDRERELAAEALAFYRGEPLPARDFRVPVDAGRPEEWAFARALAAPDADQVVHVDAGRVAWRIGDEGAAMRLAVARTEDVLRAVVPGYGAGRWTLAEDGQVPPAPLPFLRFDLAEAERAAVRAEAARARRLALLLTSGAALALLAGGIASFVALRRKQRLDARRQAFTCAVTHELKTPIANISLYAETLRDHGNADPANVPRFAAIILAEAERLRRRVQEVLDVATGQRTVPARRDRFLPAATVREVCEEYRSRGTAIELRAEDAAARGIEPLFRRAFDALLDNAAKFAPRRPVRVDLRRANGRVLVEVADGGPGIPAAERERVFEPFVRLGDEWTRSVPGTGLGLTLVRQCVEGCGGTVSIGEAEGGGARVAIELEAADG
jgi:signal transduction histidine kinase